MIRPALQAWHERTLQLLALTKQLDETKRDDTIAGIDRLLDDREKLQPHVAPPFTKEEEAFGQQLVALEKDVQAGLALFMKQIRTDITASQTKKENMKNYVNPYSQLGRDGAYYDTKQ